MRPARDPKMMEEVSSWGFLPGGESARKVGRGSTLATPHQSDCSEERFEHPDSANIVELTS